MTRAIAVPIALSSTRSATVTLPWFVQGTEYRPAQATFHPLVNGEEAFGAIYDAIDAAQRSVDIICWGFQPSMYFKRGPGSSGTLPIGGLLETKGAQGVKVRLLCWGDGTHFSQVSENMAPGNDLRSYFPDTRNSTQRDFDLAWYKRAELSDATKLSTTRKELRFVLDGAIDDIYTRWNHDKAFPNFEFATRDFDLEERAEIAWRTWHGQDSSRSTATKLGNSIVMGTFPTHHQKMVLVDYELPEHAVGFVMGHNMLDEYWDTSAHSCIRMHPQMGRNGRHPRQDMSSRETGPVLAYLNENFCQAWDDATGQSLGAARKGLASRLTLSQAGDTPVMAQVLRTQSPHHKQDIKTMYLQAVNNATNFIYIENQYFRWPPLAEKIKDVAKTLVQAGRDPGEHGSIYLFVVTNANDEAIGDGTLNTYRMLDALGRADTMPDIATLERGEALQQQLVQALEQRAHAAADANAAEAALIFGYTPARQQSWAAAKAQLAQARAQLAELEAKTGQPPATVVPTEIPGLKVHVCTLVSPNTPSGEPWEYTYVHAKLMIVDDVFTTLGSANINTRSMEADSELNICHERADVTRPLREKLWGIHTKGKGVGKIGEGQKLETVKVFIDWRNIIKENKDRQKDKTRKQSPFAPLIEFHYSGTKRSRLD